VQRRFAPTEIRVIYDVVMDECCQVERLHCSGNLEYVPVPVLFSRPRTEENQRRAKHLPRTADVLFESLPGSATGTPGHLYNTIANLVQRLVQLRDARPEAVS
jgi:hypothetical protein